MMDQTKTTTHCFLETWLEHSSHDFRSIIKKEYITRQTVGKMLNKQNEQLIHSLK